MKAKKKKLATRDDLVKAAVALAKKEKVPADEFYGFLESEIDARLYEKEYEHLGYTGDGSIKDGILLERLIFDGIKILQKGKRDQCDPYYDDAFNGYDGF